jgi:hypothetical protein
MRACAGDPDRPARRQAHRTGAIAVSPPEASAWRRPNDECDRAGPSGPAALSLWTKAGRRRDVNAIRRQ